MPMFHRVPSSFFGAVAASFALASALSLATATATAQGDCPRATSVRVPQTIQYGAVVACSGVTYQTGGISLSTTTGCPLFATIVPDHDEVRPTDKRTEVVQTGSRPGVIAYFACETSYLLFIPWSSRCRMQQESPYGVYPLLMTVACRNG